MLKKIIFTLLVVLFVFLLVRWRQRKAAEIAVVRQTAPEPKNTSVYYLAGAVITLMVVSVLFWFSIQ